MWPNVYFTERHFSQSYFNMLNIYHNSQKEKKNINI